MLTTFFHDPPPHTINICSILCRKIVYHINLIVLTVVKYMSKFFLQQASMAAYFGSETVCRIPYDKVC